MNGSVEEIAPVLNYETPAEASSPLLAIGVLTLCCVFWGYSFPVMQIATAAVDRRLLTDGAGEAERLASRGVFNGVRFALAALLYLVVTFRTQRGFSRTEVLGGAVVGMLFGVGMLGQVSGLRWTLPSVSSFLTSLPVVFAPLAQAVLFKRAVSGRIWVAVGAAMVGIVLLSWPKPEAASANTLAAVPPIAHLGELVTVFASVMFTCQILAVDHIGRRTNPVRVTFVMITTTSMVSFIAAIAGGRGLRWEAAGALLWDWQMLWTMGTLVVFSSVFALHLMNVHQPRVSPAMASVIYCTEPLFGTLFSLLLGTERLALMTVAGGAAVVASVYVVASGSGKPKQQG